MQNLSPGSSGAPQFMQNALFTAGEGALPAIGLPHSMQNLLPVSLTTPQFGQTLSCCFGSVAAGFFAGSVLPQFIQNLLPEG